MFSLLKRQCRIGSIIRYLKAMAQERERVQTFMHANQQYIKPGTYKIRRLGVAVVCQESATYNLISERVLEPHNLFRQFRLYVKQLLGGFFRIRMMSNGEKPERYQGNCILFTRWGDIKVFDGERGAVLHFVPSVPKYTHLKSNYKTFGRFFNIPVKGYHDANQIIVEHYIDGKAPASWDWREKEGALQAYCASQTAYLKNCFENGCVAKISPSMLWDSFPDELTKHSVVKKTYRLLLRGRIKKVAYAESHGDIHSDNIMLDGHNYYFMDWEFCNQHPIFFDFLHFIAREACIKNDFSLMARYFKGGYDHQ